MLSTGVDIPDAGVHRFPSPGEVPHPVGADARPRHAPLRRHQQVEFRRLRLLRRHACSSTSKTFPTSKSRSRAPKPLPRSTKSSRTSGRTSTGNTTPLPRQTLAPHRQGDELARRARNSRRFIPEGDMSAASRPVSKQESRQRFDRNDEDPARSRSFRDLLLNTSDGSGLSLIGTRDVRIGSSRSSSGGVKEYKPADYLRHSESSSERTRTKLKLSVFFIAAQGLEYGGALTELRKLAATPHGFSERTASQKPTRRSTRRSPNHLHGKARGRSAGTPAHGRAARHESASATAAFAKDIQRRSEEMVGLYAGPMRENLTIDEEDFESHPIFTDRGGFALARETGLWWCSVAAYSIDLTRQIASYVRHRQQALGVLPHPASRWHRLRRLHRAAHLSALS